MTVTGFEAQGDTAVVNFEITADDAVISYLTTNTADVVSSYNSNLSTVAGLNYILGSGYTFTVTYNGVSSSSLEPYKSSLIGSLATVMGKFMNNIACRNISLPFVQFETMLDVIV